MSKIRLVASDIDGTLMTDEGRLPEELFPVVERLTAEGVLFVVASGRQTLNMQQLFARCCDRLLFISHNGATVSVGTERVYNSYIEPDRVECCLNYAERNGADVMLYSDSTIFVDGRNELMLPFLDKHQVPYTLCSNLHDHTTGVPKLSIVKFEGDIKELKGGVEAMGVAPFVANRCMIDVTAVGTNKGVALRRIMQEHGIAREEACAFGDSENDMDLLAEAGFRYAVANAAEGLKKQAEVIGSNNDLGVVKKLKELFAI